MPSAAANAFPSPPSASAALSSAAHVNVAKRPCNELGPRPPVPLPSSFRQSGFCETYEGNVASRGAQACRNCLCDGDQKLLGTRNDLHVVCWSARSCKQASTPTRSDRATSRAKMALEISSSTARRTAARTAWQCRRTRTTKTATYSTTTPRGGATPPPRRAQPLLLLSRSNPPLRGGVKMAGIALLRPPKAPPKTYWGLDPDLYRLHLALERPRRVRLGFLG